MDAETISLITLVLAVVITILIIWSQRKVFKDDISGSSKAKTTTP